MTNEDKELLLKDLSGRLPYGVKVSVREYNDAEKLTGIDVFRQTFNIEYSINQSIFTRHGESIIKPYLRPVSSMTEEELKEYCGMWNKDDTELWDDVDWLNEHHFDFLGLIPKGLAIAVTEENNPYKN